MNQKDYSNIDIFAYRAYPYLHRHMCELYLEKRYKSLQIINKNLDRIYKDYSLFYTVTSDHYSNCVDPIIIKRLVGRQYKFYKQYLQKYPLPMKRALMYYNKSLYRIALRKLSCKDEDIHRILAREYSVLKTYNIIKQEDPNSHLLHNGEVFDVITTSINKLLAKLPQAHKEE